MNYWRRDTVLYKTLQWTAAPAIKAVWRPWIDGHENIPDEGGVILASNHLSVADHYFLALTTKRHIATMAKIEYFSGAGLKGKLVSKTVKALGQVAVDRSGGRRSADALGPSQQVLEEGRVFAIFPEGTRSPDGRLYRGKVGVARLALATGAPVVPVGMIGTEQVMPIGQSRPRVAPVGVRVGKPLEFSRYESMGAERLVLRAVTDQIMDAIRQLTGQEYVDSYAKRRPVVKKADAGKDAESSEG
ncbi:lysophospholipid acyltransferase family protein [Natronoglycomyces albus]|uniref:1-acyl-sn-glycerol-3-phosphate acyltransferase n=1 Tax=Natronoglycomyces albus TaxID=2811108 RepID=A0A895XJZ6_9ACTN|nr:lysophospholipid acyltransferase family protein [Natronoglycomyces albus]QSB05347.1 1-acyl-sn-glycerol-3-phosphate acyltransferase [Natronoglycomyces albus]